MTGKQKCAILKEIRRDIAAKNDISIRIEECTHKGECRGTCPRCEAEVRILERALEEKKKRGIKTAVAGISAGLLAASLASCTPIGETIEAVTPGSGDSTEGIVAAERTEGEIAPPDEEEAPCAPLEGDVLAEDFELAGEPPVEDYEEEDPDAEIEFAGVPVADDYTFSAEEEYPPVAGLIAPQDLEEAAP